MGGSPENETIKKYSLHIGVNESVSLREIGLTDDALKTYFTTTESEHVSVRSQDAVITGVSKGEATVTLYHPSSGSPDKHPYAAVKVYVSESETYISPSLDMTDKLFIDTSDNSKTVKLIQNDICSLKDILNKWDNGKARKDAAALIGISEYEAELYFRQAALWQIPKMTKEFAYLAALAGVRNAHDLSRVNAHNLEEAFDLLKNNIRIVYNDFEIPDHTAVNDMIQNAKSLNGRYFDYYDAEGGLPSMPSSLLDSDSFLQSDSEVINEGLKFLENINPALPLPKTISGRVMINETSDYGLTVPKGQGGLLVTVSGISDPSQDKTENEKEYSCFTSPNGEFSIVMPDRYNMQETVTFTISKKNDMRYAVAGQSSSNQVQFVKRASEILQNEYIMMTLTDENGDPLTDENGDVEERPYKASEIMTVINDIRAKNSKAMEIEKVLRKKAYNKYAREYKFVDVQLAKGRLEDCKVTVERGVRYHIRKFYEQIEDLFASFDIDRYEDYEDYEEPEEEPEEVPEDGNGELAEAAIREGNIIWQIGRVKAKPGARVKLDITVKDPRVVKLPVAGLQFRVKIHEQLSLVSGKCGGAYAVDLVVNKNEKMFAATTRDGENVIAEDKAVVATLEFTVPENCPDGVYPVEFEQGKSFMVSQTDGKDVSDSIVRLNGAVIVENPAPFRLNGDDFPLLPGQVVSLQAVPEKEYLEEAVESIVGRFETIKNRLAESTPKPYNRNTSRRGIAAARKKPVYRFKNSTVTYQWYRDGAAIDGATESCYNAAAEGEYYCKVRYPIQNGKVYYRPKTFTTNTATVRMADTAEAAAPPDVSVIVNEQLTEILESKLAAKFSEIKAKLLALEKNWASLPQDEKIVYLYTLIGHEHIGNGFIRGEDPYETIDKELFRFFEAILNDLYNLQSELRDFFNNNDFVASLVADNQIEIIQNNGGGYIDIPDCDLLYEKVGEYKRAKAAYTEAQEDYDRVCADVEYSEKGSEDDEWFEKFISGDKEDDKKADYTVNTKEIGYIDDLHIDFEYKEPPTPDFTEKVREFIPKDPDEIVKDRESTEDKANDGLIAEYKKLIDQCLDKLQTIQKLENIIGYDKKKYNTQAAAGSDGDDCRSATSKLIERCILNFLSNPMDSRFPDGAFTVNKSDFEDDPLHPRALPSVKLMGDGKNEIYLPTDTAPSRMFNYTMVHRLVEPKIKKNGRIIERTRLSGTLDIQKFKEDIRENHKEIAMADSLGIGYALNMHQAWVPDGFALGDLLYSLILAPGEEQRLIVREHNEAYTVSDESSATDRIHDSYSNSQMDNETAAFTNAVDRFSQAHSDSSYYSKATSSGSASIGLSLFKGLHGSVSSTSTNSGWSNANSYQSDSYDEASHAAQSFQSLIKTESERIASANRTSISIATSEETESVSSRIIANHNHSHVMTVQYWEVTRRYRLETCIDGVELLLFVPLELIDFMPKKTISKIVAALGDKCNFWEYNMNIKKSSKDFDQFCFELRYNTILKYYDILKNYVPYRYRGGLDLIRKYAALPEWEYIPYSKQEKVYTIEITGGFLPCDSISAEIYFDNGHEPVEGEVVSHSYIDLHPSLNTREDVVYGIKQMRKGLYTRKQNNDFGKVRETRHLFGFIPYSATRTRHATYDNTLETDIKSGASANPGKYVIEFILPDGYTENNISQIVIRNNVKAWTHRLSQNPEYMEKFQPEAIANYENALFNFSKDDYKSDNDRRSIEHYYQALPECYKTPDITFNAYEIYSYGDIDVSVKLGNEDKEKFCSVGSYGATIRVQNQIPVLTYKEIEKMEETFHHIVSDTMFYSQVVWASLSDDERIMLLEPYTIEFDDLDKIASPESKAINSGKSKTISLLNCVNAKNVIGFYGNCMMLPFTFPPELVELLGKTAGDIQDELYRHHACNFRVPSTVISVPTNGMVGEAVLGATNVSEKIDITRFWNWKDSDIDHIDIDQSSLNGRSLLENAQTKYVDAPTVGVTATEHINGNNLASALIARQQPTFADVYTNTDMREVMKNADNNASAGRAQAMEAATSLTKAALDAAVQAGTAAATGGASAALGGVGASGGISSLLGALGDAGLGNGDLGKLIKDGLGENGSLSGVAKSIAGMIGSGDSDELKSGLSAIGGEDLKQFLTKFVSNSSSDEYKNLEDNFTNSISELVKSPGSIKTQDIVNMAKKFCSENNIELSDVTSFIGNKLGLF